MKELKELTVERLEYLASLPRKAVTIGGDELAALAKIALAAKRAKPSFDDWFSSLDATIEVDCGCVTTEAFYHWIRFAYDATPPLNHTEQHMVVPDGFTEIQLIKAMTWINRVRAENPNMKEAKTCADLILRLLPAAPKLESE